MISSDKQQLFLYLGLLCAILSLLHGFVGCFFLGGGWGMVINFSVGGGAGGGAGGGGKKK
jgi:hypothetical protein